MNHKYIHIQNFLRRLPRDENIYFRDHLAYFDELFLMVDENWLYQEFNVIIGFDELGWWFKKVSWYEQKTNDLIYPEDEKYV